MALLASISEKASLDEKEKLLTEAIDGAVTAFMTNRICARMETPMGNPMWNPMWNPTLAEEDLRYFIMHDEDCVALAKNADAMLDAIVRSVASSGVARCVSKHQQVRECIRLFAMLNSDHAAYWRAMDREPEHEAAHVRRANTPAGAHSNRMADNSEGWLISHRAVINDLRYDLLGLRWAAYPNDARHDRFEDTYWTTPASIRWHFKAIANSAWAACRLDVDQEDACMRDGESRAAENVVSLCMMLRLFALSRCRLTHDEVAGLRRNENKQYVGCRSVAMQRIIHHRDMAENEAKARYMCHVTGDGGTRLHAALEMNAKKVAAEIIAQLVQEAYTTDRKCLFAGRSCLRLARKWDRHSAALIRVLSDYALWDYMIKSDAVTMGNCVATLVRVAMLNTHTRAHFPDLWMVFMAHQEKPATQDTFLNILRETDQGGGALTSILVQPWHDWDSAHLRLPDFVDVGLPWMCETSFIGAAATLLGSGHCAGPLAIDLARVVEVATQQQEDGDEDGWTVHDLAHFIFATTQSKQRTSAMSAREDQIAWNTVVDKLVATAGVVHAALFPPLSTTPDQRRSDLNEQRESFLSGIRVTGPIPIFIYTPP